MMVSPELMRASSAPSASPLNSCERKLVQVSIGAAGRGKRTPRARIAAARARVARGRSGVRTQVAAEGVGLLHQAGAGNDFNHFPEVFLVAHLAGLLAL